MKRNAVIPSVREGPGPGGWFCTMRAFSSRAIADAKTKRRHPERTGGTWGGRVVPHNEAFSSQGRLQTKNKRRHPERTRGTWSGVWFRTMRSSCPKNRIRIVRNHPPPRSLAYARDDGLSFFRQIDPIRIVLLNQPYLLIPTPSFELFLPCDGVARVCELFNMHEPRDV